MRLWGGKLSSHACETGSMNCTGAKHMKLLVNQLSVNFWASENVYIKMGVIPKQLMQYFC